MSEDLNNLSSTLDAAEKKASLLAKSPDLQAQECKQESLLMEGHQAHINRYESILAGKETKEVWPVLPPRFQRLPRDCPAAT